MPHPTAEPGRHRRPRWRDRSAFVVARARAERLRQSLFFLPALFIVLAVALSTALLLVDRAVAPGSLPAALTTTVDSSRAILSAVAGGTITAASIVFSLTLVAVQLSSGQHSPRLLRNFIGDRFQQVVIGTVVGTFTYCLLILRSVRASLDEGGRPIVPNLSVAVAVVLAVAALLAVLASIDHTARGLKVESIAERLTEETLAVIRRRFPPRDEAARRATGATGGVVWHDPIATAARTGSPASGAIVVAAPTSGWVRQVNEDVLLDALPAGSSLQLRLAVGAWLIEGAPMFDVVLADGPTLDADERAALCERLCDAVDLGPDRTMQDDVDFGVLRLVDIGLRALSPGINDPSTAIEIIMRLGTVLAALLDRELDAEATVWRDGRHVTRRVAVTFDDYLRACFDQLRQAAADQVPVYAALLRVLHTLHGLAVAGGRPAEAALLRQAAADVVVTSDRHELLERERVALHRLQPTA